MNPLHELGPGTHRCSEPCPCPNTLGKGSCGRFQASGLPGFIQQIPKGSQRLHVPSLGLGVRDPLETLTSLRDLTGGLAVLWGQHVCPEVRRWLEGRGCVWEPPHQRLTREGVLRLLG
jgi:hypothetical protein